MHRNLRRRPAAHFDHTIVQLGGCTRVLSGNPGVGRVDQEESSFPGAKTWLVSLDRS